MTADVPAIRIERAPVRVPRWAWIEAPAYDLCFFVLAPLLTLPLVLGILAGATRLTIAGFVLAFAHYLSTFTFFFWDENHAYHRARWLAFFGGPIAIAVAFALLVWLRSPVLQLALLAWNTYHVSRQSCGLLSLYRHRAGVTEPGQKALTNHAVVLTNGWFVLWNIDTHREVFPLLQSLGSALPRVLFASFAVLAVVAVGRLLLGLRARAASSRPAGLPELAMLAVSLSFFHPYLWLGSSEGATFVMLLPHYVQYLALVWLLHRRKFPAPVGSRAQVALQRLSAHLPLLLGALALGGLTFLAGKVVLTRLGHVRTFEAVYLLLAFVHFYLDGLIWAFRDPHVRGSIGPSLLAGRSAPAAI